MLVLFRSAFFPTFKWKGKGGKTQTLVGANIRDKLYLDIARCWKYHAKVESVLGDFEITTDQGEKQNASWYLGKYLLKAVRMDEIEDLDSACKNKKILTLALLWQFHQQSGTISGKLREEIMSCLKISKLIRSDVRMLCIGVVGRDCVGCALHGPPHLSCIARLLDRRYNPELLDWDIENYLITKSMPKFKTLGDWYDDKNPEFGGNKVVYLCEEGSRIYHPSESVKKDCPKKHPMIDSTRPIKLVDKPDGLNEERQRLRQEAMDMLQK
jgi:hypothetical protein